MASWVENIHTKKLSKSDNWFSSKSQKMLGMFFETQCRLISSTSRWPYKVSCVAFTFATKLIRTSLRSAVTGN